MNDRLDFQERVINYVKNIPWGKVSTYGRIARACGMPSAARHVGYVMNRCRDRDDVPCHRVVNRNGYLTGRLHFDTPGTMEERLSGEGIEFDNIGNDMIKVDLDRYLWEADSE